MKFSFAVALLLAALPAFAAPGLPPRLIPYQGVLERDATPLNAATDLEFFFVTTSSGTFANKVWSELHPATQMTQGRFSVVLGGITPFPSDIFANATLFVGVKVNGTELAGVQQIHSAPYAIRAVETIPVGAVIDWWRPNGTFPIPDGYVVCDGRMISDALSPYNGTATPDLRGKFVRGAVTSGTGVQEREVGPTGTVPVDVAVTVANGGGHGHPWASFEGVDWFSWDAFGNKVTVVDWNDGMDTAGAGDYPLELDHSAIATFFTQPNTGAHSHAASGHVDVPANAFVPPYVGMLKLMRVR